MADVPRPHINPMGLSLREREVSLDLLESLERSMVSQAYALHEHGYDGRGVSYMEARDIARQQVIGGARRLLRGTARTSKAFSFSRDLPEDDLAYLRKTFGVEVM